MRKNLAAIICATIIGLLILLILTESAAVSASPVKCELLLRFKPGVNGRLRGMFLSAMGLEVVDEIPQIDVLVVEVPENALPMVKAALKRNPMVEFVEENLQLSPMAVPNDPYYSFQWHLKKIEAPAAWNFSLGNPNVLIAVLDSGVDSSHPDLKDKLLQGYNFYDNNGDTSDVAGHGTAVAGVAAAATNNSIGVAGIAWKCSIIPVRVTDTKGYTTYSLLSKGLVYAADKGAKAATISFLIYNGASLSTAAKYFMDKGGLVVAAGGNTGNYEDYADNPYIVSVSGTTSSDVNWGSYGPYIDLSAPCSAIYTTIKGGGYGNVGGTSFSAPLTAGLAALIFSVNPSLTPGQVEQILECTAVDLGEPGYDIYYGWGRIDAAKALAAAAGVPLTPPDNSPPKVVITYPMNGTAVSGGVTVAIDASDEGGVSKVELYKNGTIFAADSDAPYEFYWDTASDPDGAYTLMAKAYDKAGNVGASNAVCVSVSNTAAEFTVTDTNPPAVIVTQPADGSKVSKMVDVKVSAWDEESDVSRVEFYIDGKLAAADSADPYVYRWNTRSVKDGEHTITVTAYDSYGNYAETRIKVYVANRK